MTESVKRLRLDGVAADTSIVQYAGMPSPASAEMDSAALATAPVITITDATMTPAPALRALPQYPEDFFDPALPIFEQQLNLSITDLSTAILDPNTFPFAIVSFSKPGDRKRDHSVDKKVSYTCLELQALLLALLNGRVALATIVHLDGNLIEVHQPYDYMLAKFMNYMTTINLDHIYDFVTTFSVEDEEILQAFRHVVQKQMVLHVVKDGQKVAAQTDPKAALVHYYAREAAAKGYQRYDGKGSSCYHVYED